MLEILSTERSEKTKITRCFNLKHIITFYQIQAPGIVVESHIHNNANAKHTSIYKMIFYSMVPLSGHSEQACL
jgi:hypothetical protein